MDTIVDWFRRCWCIDAPCQSPIIDSDGTGRNLSRLVKGVLLVGVAVIGFGATVNSFSEPNQPPTVKKTSVVADELSSVEPRHHFVRYYMTADEQRDPIAKQLLPPGTKSLLKVTAPMKHGDYVWNEDGIEPGRVNIRVDLRRQMISAYRNGHEIGTAVIVYGAGDKASPEGTFHILSKKRHYHSRTYDAAMPASLFISNDGVALHGSPMSARRASHGCIGLPIDFAEQLFDAARVGDRVEITRSSET